MDSLSELVHCCRALNTDKLTERKKQTDKFRLLLGKISVQKALDENTDAKQMSREKTIFAWDSVFKVVVDLVWLETSTLKKAKESTSSTAISNREKKKQDISGLVKFVVRITDKRGERLKCSSVMTHVLEVLKDPYTCQAYGPDYSSLLLKNILCVRKYASELTPKMWQELISIYTKLFRSKLPGFNRVIVARLIHTFVIGASQQLDVRPRKLLSFFTEVFKNIRHENVTLIVEHLVSAMTAVVKFAVYDGRKQVCRLGEEVFSSLLYLLGHRPTDSLKETVLEFLHLQLRAHHPHGARTEDTGAFAHDWAVWQSHLRKLYEAVYSDLRQMGGRNKFSSGFKEAVLKPAYLELIADLCHQLFTEQSGHIEVTQASTNEDGPSAKKRRLESGWSCLRDALSSCHRSVQSIPWLQLLSRLMRKYPGSLPDEEVPLLLNLLIPVITECKRSEVVSHSLVCIESLAGAVSSKPGCSHMTSDTMQSLWTKTWASTLRLISLHQCARECFSVMSALVLGHLLTPNKDMWNLFFTNICTPTPESIRFLIIYLSEYDVPDNYHPSVLGVSHPEHTGSYHLRKQLCDWLLVSQSDLNDQSTKEYLNSKSVLFAEALAALILKDCRKGFKQMRSDVMKSSVEMSLDDSDFEDLYLSYTFNDSVRLTQGVLECNKAVVQKPATIPLLLEHINQLIDTDLLSVVENSDPSVTLCEWMVLRCTLSLRFMSRLLSCGVITEDQVLHSPMLETAQALMKKMSTALSDRIKKDGLCSVRPVLNALEDMMGAGLGEESVDGALTHILQQATPTQLIDTLLDEATGSASTKRSSSRLDSSISLSGRRRNLISDDFDLESEMSNNNNTEDFGLESSPQDIDDTVDQSRVYCASLASSEALSDHQLTRVQIVRILVSLCRTESSLPVQQQLEELLDDPHFDPTRAVDVHILREVLSGLTRIKRVNGENLQKLLDALRQMAKCHRHDQDLCALVLDLITALVPELCRQGQTNESDARAECLNISVHLLSVFRKLQERGDVMHKVRLALTKCLKNFLATCPGKGDLVLCGSSDGGGDEEDVTLWQGFLVSVSDNCLIVRRYVARALTCLFQTEANACGTLPSPSEVFSKMYDFIRDSMDLEGKLTVDEQLDETLNRTSSLLTAMTTVAHHSSICEKKAIFTCLQLIREKNHSIQLVKKGFEQTGARLGFSSVRAYLSSHLRYLVSNWLDLEYPMLEFPFELLNYTTRKEFFQQHYKVVFPCLLMLGQVDTVMEICTELGSDWLKLLEGCIPETLVFILPLFAMCKGVDSPNQSLKARFALASACYDLLMQSATQQVVEKCIVSNLDHIVVNILMTLYDSEGHLDTSSISRWKDPEPNPPFYKPAVISSTLDYLTQSFSGKNHSLVAVLSKTQDAIQNILLSLSLHVSEAHRSHEKYRVLMMYRLFVGLLTREFEHRLGGSWAFVLREVVYRTIHIFTQGGSGSTAVVRSCWDKQYQPLIEGICLDILTSVCEVALQHCPQELGKYLSFIVSQLVGHVNPESPVSDKVLSLLRCLCVDNAGPLSSSIASLNQFPDLPQLKDIRKIHKKIKYSSGPFSLEQELSHFLRASRLHTSAPESLCGGLDFLCEQLSERSEELNQLVTRCASSSKLCDLVWELVHLCTSPHQRVQMAASRCLGEIGPANLGLASVAASRHSPSLEGALEEYAESPEDQKYCVIFHLLDDCLTDQCVHVVQSASNVLKSMLSTNIGQRFCADYKAKLQDKDFLFQYLHPFQQGKKSTSRAKPPAQLPSHKKTELDDDEVWCPDHLDHRRWVIGLVVHILRSGAVSDQILANLEPVCTVKKKVSEVILPYLIHDILKNGSSEQRNKLSKQISGFFSRHCAPIGSGKGNNSGQTSSYNSGNGGAVICENKESVKVLLSVIQYLRQQDVSSGSKQTPFEKNLWLDIDYSTVAEAAYNCSAYFTSVLYTEIWAEINRLKSQNSRSGKRQSLSGRSTSQPSQSSGDSGEWSQGTQPLGISSTGVNTEELLLQTYLAIGDPDGIYGCGAGKTPDNKSRIKTYEHERQWDKAAVAYAVGMNQPDSTAQHAAFLKAMKNCGSYRLVGHYVSWLPGDNVTFNPELEELQYESAWRLGDWKMDVPTSLEHLESGSNKSLYCAMKAFHDNQTEDIILKACQAARCVSLKQMTEASWESTRPLYPVLSNLHSLNHIEHLVQASSGEANLTHLLEKWSRGLGQGLNEFEFLEPPLSVQSCLLGFLVKSLDANSPVHKAYVSHLERLVTWTRAAGRFELAGDILCKVQSLPGPDNLSWQIEEACLYWDRGEQTTGKHLLKAYIDKLTTLIKERNPEASRLYPLVLMKYGNWLADTRSDSPNVIMEKYLEKAVRWLESHGDSAGFSLDAYLSLARYADTQYTNIVSYMNSPKFESKRNLMKKAKEELEKYRNLADKRDRYLRTLEKQGQIDDSELLVLEQDRKAFLLRALHSYVRCLRCGDKHDLRIFRVISLWFDNAAIPEVNEYIMEAVDGVKTQKFLPLMYQLAARMSTTPVHHPRFKPTLDRLIARTATDHPYQTLLIILALAHANKDSEILNQGRDSKRGRLKKSASDLDTPDEERVLAAKNMVEKLRSSKVGKILTDTEKLCVAYIELANFNVDKYKRETKAIPLPTTQQITQIKNLHSAVSPTSVVAVDPACEYSDIKHVIGFQPTFKLAGGVNLPKIITCISSDGTWSKQLVKGKDDLRQDAVMQQVFEMVNSLLLKESETRQRNLSIRTYKVVPLSQRSGLLEWCEGTQPLGEYLVGNLSSGVQGAHARYRPHDLAAIDCRRKMSTVHADPSPEKKHKVYRELCSQFLPVFRHFFLEKYLEPAQWYQRRLAYTRSVATNSIVGYILGLGDRHVQNILIDYNTAELIHIDLGVAFEQGHILPTPETVPFRLTRDIVDGMGITGVEGVFRRCCEKTMGVMHQNQESLLTILQVLLYDPLYTWTISPLKAYSLQQDRQQADTSDLNTTGELISMEQGSGESSEKVNKLAERTLLRLHEKLQGIEDGVQLSVLGQVNHLIQEACDTKNLCKLFPGWQPYI